MPIQNIVHMHNIVMPRPLKHRRCRTWNGHRVFKPIRTPISSLEIVPLQMSELEAMRLCDYEQMEQSEAGEQMQVSRGTIHRLLKSGRRKVLHVLLNSQALEIKDDLISKTSEEKK